MSERRDSRILITCRKLVVVVVVVVVWCCFAESPSCLSVRLHACQSVFSCTDAGLDVVDVVVVHAVKVKVEG